MKYTVICLLLFVSLSSVAEIQKTAGSLKIATYNIRNFDYDERSSVSTNKKFLAKQISTINADILGVQEIKEEIVFENFIKKEFGRTYKVRLSECGGSHDQKLGVVYKAKRFKLISFDEDLSAANPNGNGDYYSYCRNGSRPFVIAKLRDLKTNKIMTVIVVHLKAGGQPKSIEKRFQQLKLLRKLVDRLSSKGQNNLVALGDFNSTEYYPKGKVYRKFQRLVQVMNLNETTEKLKCSSYWWGDVDDYKQYPSRLDHILASNSLTRNKKVSVKVYGHCRKLKCAITDETDLGTSFDEVSDHCPISIEIK